MTWALHCALEDGHSAAPPEWMVSRYCEEFGCTPPVAREEMATDVDGLGFIIMALRAYRSVKEQFDRASDGGSLPKPSATLDRVKVNTERYIRERTKLVCRST